MSVLIYLCVYVQFEPLRQWLPSECVLKADQWIQLSRRHAEDVIRLVDALRAQRLDLFQPFSQVSQHRPLSLHMGVTVVV